MVEASTQNFESRDAALKEGGGTPKSNLVKMWLTAIDASSKDEEAWRKEGDEILEIYRSSEEQRSQTAFNILYSNTETLLPALYNSTPVPDIRRRFNDPGVASKAVADILERAISYSLDMQDFDGTMRSVLFDATVPGRGLARERYSPVVAGASDEGPEAKLDDTPDDEAAEGEQVVSHEVRSEYVAWKNFRRGPGLVWEDVDWIAFEHFLSREQLIQLDKTIGAKVTLDCTTTGEDNHKHEHEGDQASGDIFGRARVWEIWDRINKEVLFIAPSYVNEPIKIAQDPLKLTGFYPIPRPLGFLETPTNLVPVPPYHAYKALAEELNEVTARIRKIVRQIRVKGYYATTAADMQEIVDADDGDLVPIPGLEMYVANGGFDKAIAWWPIEPATKALAQLYEQRDLIKQTIYEVCGVADIMRGATQASETLGAQQIKQQWGSLRIQRAQAEVARFCRDLFRIKAELIATFFDMQTLMKMTGVELFSQNDKAIAQQKAMLFQQQQQQLQQPPVSPQQVAAQGGAGAAPPPAPPPQQALPDEITKVLQGPSLEEVEQLLRSDLMRGYKIDVESDSTIRADLTRNQEAMTGFVQGAAAYIQAVGPAIMSGIMPKSLAVEIFGAFSRQFRLGKQVEDALELASSNAREEAENPPPPQPNPEVMKAQSDIQLAQQKQQAEMQAKGQELQMKQAEMQATLQMKQQELEMKLQLEREKMQQQLQLAHEKHQMELSVAATQAETQQQIAQEQHQAEMARASEAHQSAMARENEGYVLGQSREADAHDFKMKQAKSEADLRVEEHNAKFKPPKPAPRKVKIVRGKDGKIEGAEIQD